MKKLILNRFLKELVKISLTNAGNVSLLGNEFKKV